jgi:cell division septation protein DedD
LPQPVAEAARALPAPTPTPQAVVSTQADADLSVLADFAPETEQPGVDPPSVTRAATRQAWASGIAASILAFSVLAGGLAWYLRAQTVEANVAAPVLPPPPPVAFSRPAGAPTPTEPAVAVPARADSVAPAASAIPAEDGAYTIVVASFESRARAERLVEELTSAGYRAHAVERDWGPPRGRLVQVNVGGYSSAIGVQRDLQRIRELPGGYSDALIVERD